ncbi:hypothetical protein ACWDKQ_27660 [Saccharopolyspora sp. NPDC000995]
MKTTGLHATCISKNSVGDLRGIRKGCDAVFAIAKRSGETERLAVIAETRRTEPAGLQACTNASLPPGLTSSAQHPTTSSARHLARCSRPSIDKIRRAASRESYDDVIG